MNMLNRDSQADRTHVLILGAPRSGTSILASLIGAHPDIALCSEDFSNTWTTAIGKPVVGNKLCVPNQIQLTAKKNLITELLKRLGVWKRFPLSYYSVKDYLKIPNLKIIFIIRDRKKNAESMARRGSIKRYFLLFKWKRKLKENEIKKILDQTYITKEILENRENVMTIRYKDLIREPEKTLTSIFNFLNVPVKDLQSIIKQGTRWNWMYSDSSKSLDTSKI
ncbi:MAG: sulfotransferase [Candidatus Marinimicrobia bacterium]|nr:sulfotransferase [Candidatus Neomarinimicrobiota bacterium]